MKKTVKKKDQNKKFKSEKSNRIVNAVVLIFVSLLLSIAWLNEIKKVAINDLVKINGKLVSYENRVPEDRGTGFESRALFVKLDNYKAEFKLHIDYDLFTTQTKKYNEIEIESYIEPKYLNSLDKAHSDIETLGLFINGINFSDTKDELKKRNTVIKYGVPIIVIVLFIWGVCEILRSRAIMNKTKLEPNKRIEKKTPSP